MACSSAGSAFASLDLSTACAASKRFPGSGAINVKPPSAASTIRRRRLLRRTGARAEGALPATGSPVAASIRRARGASRMKTRLVSALKRNRPSVSAPMTAAARGCAGGGRGGDCVDTLNRVVEAVGREAEEPVLVGSRARRRHQGGEHAKRTYERDEAIAEGTHPDRPGISERGGPMSGIWAASIPATNTTLFLLPTQRHSYAPPHFLVTVL